MYLLDSGFTPQNCAVLREKLHKVVRTAITNYVKTYRMDVEMSVTSFLVPGASPPLSISVYLLVNPFLQTMQAFLSPARSSTRVLGGILLCRMGSTPISF